MDIIFHVKIISLVPFDINILASFPEPSISDGLGISFWLALGLVILDTLGLKQTNAIFPDDKSKLFFSCDQAAL